MLTSGAAASCVQGVDVLCSLLAERDRTNGPEVLIGAGVNAGGDPAAFGCCRAQGLTT